MERAATLTPPYLPPLGGPQHQNVASQEEDISPSSWPGKEGFTTLMAPTHLPWGPDALICTNPSGILVLGPCPVHELCCDGAAAGQSCHAEGLPGAPTLAQHGPAGAGQDAVWGAVEGPKGFCFQQWAGVMNKAMWCFSGLVSMSITQ